MKEKLIILGAGLQGPAINTAKELGVTIALDGDTFEVYAELP